MSSSHALTPQPTTHRRRRTTTPPGPRQSSTGSTGSTSTASRAGSGLDLHPHARRLLELCWDLAGRASIALAHDHIGAVNLLRSRVQVDEALRARFPGLIDLLTEIEVWEAENLHVSDGPAQRCLICRRIQLELAELPFRGRLGGAR